MLIASCAKDVIFHSSQNGKLLHTYKLKEGNNVKNISWSKDGCWLTAVSNNGTAELLSIREDTTKLLQTISGIQGINVSTFHKTTKKHITVGTEDGIVAVYDLKGKNVIKQFKKAKSSIVCIDCNAVDSHFAAACYDEDVMLLSNTTNQVSNFLTFPREHTATVLRFHRNKRHILAAGSISGSYVALKVLKVRYKLREYSGSICVWDINTGKIKWDTQAHAGPVTDVVFSPLKDNLLFTIAMDRKFSFYDVNVKKSVLEMNVDKALTCVDIHKDGTVIAMGSIAGNVMLYDLRNMAQPANTVAAHKSKVINIRFQPAVPEENRKGTYVVDISEESTPRSMANTPSLNVINTDILSPFLSSMKTDENIQIDANSTPFGGGDSFLDAIGGLGVSNVSKQDYSSYYDKCVIVDSYKNGGSYVNQDAVNENVSENEDKEEIPCTIGSSKPNYTKIQASTPKIFANSPLLHYSNKTESPIISSSLVGSNPNDKMFSSDELKSIVKDVAEEIKTEMREEIMIGLAQIRHQFMNLHMSILREFVSIDNNVTALRDELSGNLETDPDVSEENSLLKRQVQMLQRQIREMQMKD